MQPNKENFSYVPNLFKQIKKINYKLRSRYNKTQYKTPISYSKYFKTIVNISYFWLAN